MCQPERLSESNLLDLHVQRAPVLPHLHATMSPCVPAGFVLDHGEFLRLAFLSDRDAAVIFHFYPAAIEIACGAGGEELFRLSLEASLL